jgi:hypothetical protein
MSEPVLVVHGVANHDPEQFKRTVAALQARVGERFKLIEVFWGDLGGVSNGLKDSLPVIFPRIDVTRGGEEGEAFFELVQAQRDALMGTEVTRAEETAVIDALYRSTLQAGGVAQAGAQDTRGGDDDLREALAEQVPATRYLKQLHDPQLQQAVGELLAEYLRAQPVGDTFGVAPGEIVTRGWVDDTKRALKGFIGKVDDLIGRVTSNLAGSANQWVRGALADPIALTLGDIVAYHQRRGDIHRRLFEALDAQAPGYGTAERPIAVMAHSLGGLVTFDAALGSDVLVDDVPRRLHIKRWITFGSQPAFFHVLAPRNGIPPYTPGQLVALPSSIGPWTNLWHPLDLLAFSASSVFRLADGSVPLDTRVDSSASDIVQSKGWLHSAYWESPKLRDALLAGAAG